MSKVDFDFSGISGEKRQKVSEQPKGRVTDRGEIVTGAIDDKRGITLTFPVKGGWESKDIAHVTPDEFLAWAADVYPAEIAVEKSRLEKLAARITIFNKILKYHMDSPFQVGKIGPGQKREKLLPN